MNDPKTDPTNPEKGTNEGDGQDLSDHEGHDIVGQDVNDEPSDIETRDREDVSIPPADPSEPDGDPPLTSPAMTEQRKADSE